jgi:ABC-2 type transport system permease protein
VGYVVISVFLIANGVFIWILPGSNLFDFGYARLDALFDLAPWIFMFLVPAITMRSFAEERRSGTMELLFTKPISDLKVILAKYFANLTLALFSIIPTFIYYIALYRLASPAGNIDHGGIIGSYIGLVFLAAIYVSAGVFASSVYDNQIISFILSLFICFFFYILIDLIRGFFVISPIDPFLQFISIKTHYSSISRGIIDTRDILYFLSFILIFILLTRMVIEKRKW